MGQLDDAAAQALAAAVAAPPHTYLWGRAGADRGRCHPHLPSVLVWRAVAPGVLVALPRGHRPPRGVDACAILAAAHMPWRGGAGGAGLG